MLEDGKKCVTAHCLHVCLEVSPGMPLDIPERPHKYPVDPNLGHGPKSLTAGSTYIWEILSMSWKAPGCPSGTLSKPIQAPRPQSAIWFNVHAGDFLDVPEEPRPPH
jgi:hypothetical protein